MTIVWQFGLLLIHNGAYPKLRRRLIFLNANSADPVILGLEVFMTDPNHDRKPDCDVYFAKLMVALELRQTHGIIFAAAFLDQFAPEIGRAAYRAIQMSRSADELARRG